MCAMCGNTHNNGGAYKQEGVARPHVLVLNSSMYVCAYGKGGGVSAISRSCALPRQTGPYAATGVCPFTYTKQPRVCATPLTLAAAPDQGATISWAQLSVTIRLRHRVEVIRCVAHQLGARDHPA